MNFAIGRTRLQRKVRGRPNQNTLRTCTRSKARQWGSTMVEFAVVAPLMALMGGAITQYAMIFNAKNVVNYAAFMAAREGSLEHSNMGSIKDAYVRALIPLYGGGTDVDSLKQSYARANADVINSLKIELVNPTKESFDDWADVNLSSRYNGKRVLNVSKISTASNQVGTTSGQDFRDANLIKLRITHGYKLNVPLISTVMQFMLRWYDDGSNSFTSDLYKDRRVPVVSHVTMAMQSDAVEQSQTVSIPGLGNQGSPVDPGSTAVTPRDPPMCLTAGCTVIVQPGGGGQGGSTGGSSTGGGNGSSGGGSGGVYSCQPGDPICTLLCTGA